MEKLRSRLGMERCCVEAGRVLDDELMNTSGSSAAIVQLCESTHPKIH